MNINPQVKARIVDAANALVAQGITHPTNAQVLESMGRGSLSHVSPVMRQWRTERQQSAQAALEMPTALKEILEHAAGQLWKTASTLATEELEQLKQHTQTEIAQTQSERDEALAEIAKLEKKLATLQQECDQVSTQHQELQVKERQTEQELIQCRTENTAFKERIKEKKSTITTLTANLKEARADNKKLQGKLLKHISPS